MASLIQLYLEYRRVGLGRLASFRYAWTIASTRRRPMSVR